MNLQFFLFIYVVLLIIPSMALSQGHEALRLKCEVVAIRRNNLNVVDTSITRVLVKFRLQNKTDHDSCLVFFSKMYERNFINSKKYSVVGVNEIWSIRPEKVCIAMGTELVFKYEVKLPKASVRNHERLKLSLIVVPFEGELPSNTELENRLKKEEVAKRNILVSYLKL